MTNFTKGGARLLRESGLTTEQVYDAVAHEEALHFYAPLAPSPASDLDTCATINFYAAWKILKGYRASIKTSSNTTSKYIETPLYSTKGNLTAGAVQLAIFYHREDIGVTQNATEDIENAFDELRRQIATLHILRHPLFERLLDFATESTDWPEDFASSCNDANIEYAFNQLGAFIAES
jgi:hypothetical protein